MYKSWLYMFIRIFLWLVIMIALSELIQSGRSYNKCMYVIDDKVVCEKECLYAPLRIGTNEYSIDGFHIISTELQEPRCTY